MKLPFLILSAVLASSWRLPVTTLPATAQQPVACGKREDMVKALQSQYGETPRAIGLANQSTAIEIFTSRAGTWTILITRPSGASCIVSAGEAWEETPPPQAFTML